MMNELQSETLSSHEVVRQEASLHISLTLSKQECNSRASLIFLPMDNSNHQTKN